MRYFKLTDYWSNILGIHNVCAIYWSGEACFYLYNDGATVLSDYWDLDRCKNELIEIEEEEYVLLL